MSTDLAFVKGRKYPLTADWQEFFDGQDDGQGNACIGYHYAVPVSSGNYYVCDCWIVNEQGDRHPGYNQSPYPLNRDVLIRDEA